MMMMIGPERLRQIETRLGDLVDLVDLVNHQQAQLDALVYQHAALRGDADLLLECLECLDFEAVRAPLHRRRFSRACAGRPVDWAGSLETALGSHDRALVIVNFAGRGCEASLSAVSRAMCSSMAAISKDLKVHPVVMRSVRGSSTEDHQMCSQRTLVFHHVGATDLPGHRPKSGRQHPDDRDGNQSGNRTPSPERLNMVLTAPPGLVPDCLARLVRNPPPPPPPPPVKETGSGIQLPACLARLFRPPPPPPIPPSAIASQSPKPLPGQEKAQKCAFCCRIAIDRPIQGTKAKYCAGCWDWWLSTDGGSTDDQSAPSHSSKASVVSHSEHRNSWGKLGSEGTTEDSNGYGHSGQDAQGLHATHDIAEEADNDSQECSTNSAKPTDPWQDSSDPWSLSSKEEDPWIKDKSKDPWKGQKVSALQGAHLQDGHATNYSQQEDDQELADGSSLTRGHGQLVEHIHSRSKSSGQASSKEKDREREQDKDKDGTKDKDKEKDKDQEKEKEKEKDKMKAKGKGKSKRLTKNECQDGSPDPWTGGQDPWAEAPAAVKSRPKPKSRAKPAAKCRSQPDASWISS